MPRGYTNKRFEVLGVEDAVKRMKRIYDVFDDKVALQDIFVAGAQMFQEEAIARAPRHSGLLASMIKVERRGGKNLTAVLVVHQRDVRYVSFVELGSAHAPAEPFIRPALDARGPRVVEYIAATLRQRIERAAQ